MHTEHEFEGTISNKRKYAASVVVRWEEEEHGIGPYEWWGHVEYDSQTVWAPYDFFIEDITIYDKDGEQMLTLNHNDPHSEEELEVYDEVEDDVSVRYLDLEYE